MSSSEHKPETEKTKTEMQASISNTQQPEEQGELPELYDPDQEREETKSKFKTTTSLDVKRLEPTNSRITYKNRLKSRIRNKDETIPELYLAIKELTEKAYPKVSKAVEHEITLDYFLEAINDENMELYIISKRPTTMEEAVHAALNFEILQKLKQDRQKIQDNRTFRTEEEQQRRRRTPTFDGSTSFKNFMSQFNISAIVNGWTDEEKAIHLASSLRGATRGALAALDNHNLECNELVAALEE